MSSLIAPRNAIEYPVRTLVILWAIYKAIILLIAIPTPGPGYDTSTHLYEHQISKDAETCGWLVSYSSQLGFLSLGFLLKISLWSPQEPPFGRANPSAINDQVLTFPRPVS